VLRSAETWITHRRTRWERNLDRLGEYLTDPQPGGPKKESL
jgi:hypothetical protein